MNKSKIEWTEVTWNPVTGCTPISPGCENCYARRMATRLRGRFGYPEDDPFRVTVHPERLEEPLKWKKPLLVFVCSMGDLFHELVPKEFLVEVFRIMEKASWHTFLVLTKRPLNAKRFLDDFWDGTPDWALKNVWLGVTVENQQAANKRIPVLLETPAVVRFVSCEPLLGPVDLTCLDLGDQVTQGYGPRRIIWDALKGWEKQYKPGNHPGQEQTPKCMSNHIGRLHWVICGGETGPGARPMHPDWVRSLRDQCIEARVPFFFKQWGEWAPFELVTDHYALRKLITYDGTLFGEYCGWGCDRRKRRFAQVVRVGRKAAGRLLDGRTWDEFPEVFRRAQ